jgi:hypothetical protein
MKESLLSGDPTLARTLRIRFRGQEFWLLDELYPGAGRAIAPLEHCDAKGELEDFEQDSFAHLCIDGKIRRYLRVIGDQTDIEVLTPSSS